MLPLAVALSGPQRPWLRPGQKCWRQEEPERKGDIERSMEQEQEQDTRLRVHEPEDFTGTEQERQ